MQRGDFLLRNQSYIYILCSSAHQITLGVCLQSNNCRPVVCTSSSQNIYRAHFSDIIKPALFCSLLSCLVGLCVASAVLVRSPHTCMR